VCETMGNVLTRIKAHIHILLGGIPGEIRTAMLIKIQIFWDLTSCRLVNNYHVSEYRITSVCRIQLSNVK
jgi:hypothetical protein